MEKSINEHISDGQDQVEVYDQLCVLLLEQNVKKLHSLLQQMMSYLYEHQRQFFEYFKYIYVSQCEQWATRYDVGSIVNKKNMFTGQFHGLLKVMYLENKQNQRVDKLLHVLFRIACNLVYEQLLKEEKGKTIHCKSEINKRHKSALAIADTCQVLELTKEEWKLELQGNQDVFYIVQLLQSSCTCK